ncbi:MAG: glycosyltransferase [Thermodesulfovibrionia bacterium]|nr:glycosyltransferase [Thermodesulfovibrionia bacterium]
MPSISIVIPNYNMAGTIGICLEAALASEYDDFEVIVVDDNSSDNSVDIIKEFPCRLICLYENAGASKARNIGAQNSTGDIIFFTDADCLLQKDTLSAARRIISKEGDIVLGGTYTVEPFDKDFFSRFQSVSINYSETKNTADPDYIATHAMAIHSRTFKESNGFPEDFLPMLEDVEFSHRMKGAGKRLVMNPDIKVQHVFNFSFSRSLKNAFKKSRYWIIYSLSNKDLTADSGCASSELKFNVLSFFVTLLLLASWAVFQQPLSLYLIPLTLTLNIALSRKLIMAFYRENGTVFAILSLLYWIVVYPVPVCAGGISGLISALLKK